MRKSLQAGESLFLPIAILAVLLVIVFTLPKDYRRLGQVNPGIVSTTPGTPTNNSVFGESSGTLTSTTLQAAPQAQMVFLGTGNAPYSYQSYEEYITLDNQSNAPINITGWQLRNGMDKRPYYNGNTLQRYSADIAIIPQATNLFVPGITQALSNVVLQPGERAIVTTGSVNVQSPYHITSFKENMCTGYIEALPDYAFTPPLTQNCPRPSIEPGIENLDRECRDFVTYYPSCQTPRFESKDKDGYPCETCINGKRLTSHCAAFIKEHFSYQGCVANHSRDTNFSGRTWRIFLARGWEMWADKYETIELFNSSGQLVDFQNY